MAKRYYSAEDVRKAFTSALQGRSQASVCRELGLKAQNLSVMVKGGPINGRVLTWLGFRRVTDAYERVK